ncbi:actin-like ATPase domain-containing protein [Marasmius fiardii PR-910]|nr:actin-like ATPase domain-containing protein [Marasmius fiardii PR-910]
MESSTEVHRVPTPSAPSIPPPLTDSYDNHRDNETPLIIDNGSTTLRWGFATSSDPASGPNIIAKYKDRKSNRPLLLFGDGVEVEGGAKAQGRTPWEGDVLLNFDALENALDYTFIKLGIDTEAVNHPVLMTERLCSPLHSRALTSELMFEQYCVPSLTYCVDGVMSFYYNNLPPANAPFTSDGMVISFNTASTSVIPILHGKGLMSHAKRIPWGASQSSEYLLKLIQLKYANFPTRVTSTQANWMLRNFCEVAEDYTSLIRTFKDPNILRASEKIIQFPFTVPVADEKTEEELARASEKRKEQGRKLQEMAAKTRMEKLAQKETDYQYLLELKESKGDLGKREWQNKLQTEGFDDESTLDETLKKLDNDLKRARKKEASLGGGDDAQEEEPPSFPLADVPDDQLDEEGLKEKKKQKLLRAGFEARARARKEKEREKEEREKEEKREEEEREADPGAWGRKMRQEQETLMARIKDRQKRKAALSDRKSAAAQARMKSIANLASDERVPKKKRKGGGEDMFGADDADWAIYRKINTATVSSDEEEDLNQLNLVEQKLLQHDPSFTNQHTYAHLNSQRSALLTAFRPIYEEGDVEGNSRIHLNTERWRVCETWFSPGTAGVDSAGLGEVIQNILSRFDNQQKSRIVQNVMITGTPSQIPGIVRRLHSTLRPILPPEMPIGIRSAEDPSNDAWRGMAKFSLTDEFATVGVTKAEYEEFGGERVKRWWGGNWNGSQNSPSSNGDGDIEMT